MKTTVNKQRLKAKVKNQPFNGRLRSGVTCIVSHTKWNKIEQSLPSLLFDNVTLKRVKKAQR